MYREKLAKLVNEQRSENHDELTDLDRDILVAMLRYIFIETGEAIYERGRLKPNAIFRTEKELRDLLNYFGITIDDLRDISLSDNTVYYEDLFRYGLMKFRDFATYIIEHYPDRIIRFLIYPLWDRVIYGISCNMKGKILIKTFTIQLLIGLIGGWLLDMHIVDIVDVIILFSLCTVLLMGYMIYEVQRTVPSDNYTSFKQWKKKVVPKLKRKASSQHEGEDPLGIEETNLR